MGFGCAHALILSKVKAVLGLDQSKVNITSAAPIAVEVSVENSRSHEFGHD